MSLSSILSSFKSGIKSAGQKIATEANLFKEAAEETRIKAADKVASIKEAFQGQKEMVTGAISDAYKGKTISDVTNQALGDFAKGAEYGARKLGKGIDTTLGIQSDFEGALGGFVGTVAGVPKSVTEGLRSGIDTSAELVGTIQGGGSKSQIASKALKTVVDPALAIISATPVPMLVQGTLKATGLQDEAQGGVDFLKGGLGETLTLAGVDDDTAKELSSSLIDGAQVLLSLKGGQVSSKAGGKATVQGALDSAKQTKILDSVRAKAAARPGATPATIAAAVERAKPLVSQAKASPVSWGDVAAYNLKKVGFDVAANTALPVLGIAMQGVKDGDYNSIEDALSTFAVNAAMTIPGVGKLGVKKSKKSTPLSEQLKLDIAAEKPGMPSIKESIQQDTAKTTPSRTIQDDFEKLYIEGIDTGIKDIEGGLLTANKMFHSLDINNDNNHSAMRVADSIIENLAIVHQMKVFGDKIPTDADLIKMGFTKEQIENSTWNSRLDYKDLYKNAFVDGNLLRILKKRETSAKSQTPIPKETQVAPVKEVPVENVKNVLPVGSNDLSLLNESEIFTRQKENPGFIRENLIHPIDIETLMKLVSYENKLGNKQPITREMINIFSNKYGPFPQLEKSLAESIDAIDKGMDGFGSPSDRDKYATVLGLLRTKNYADTTKSPTSETVSQKEAPVAPVKEAVVEKPTSDVITLKESSKKILDEITDEVVGEKKISNFEVKTTDGGRAFGTIEGDKAIISGINAPKKGDSAIEPQRGTRTFPRVIEQLKNKGVRTISVPTQSLDSQAVLSRLVADGTLVNPRGKTGSSNNEHYTIFDIALPKDKPLSQMLVNRDTANVITAADRQKYIIDNAERFLESGKGPNGKKLTKKDIAALNIVVQNKNRIRNENANILADNQGVVVQDTPLLPSRTPETARADTARREKNVDLFTKDYQRTQDKVNQSRQQDADTIERDQRLSKEFEDYLIANTPKPLEVTTLPDYTKLDPLTAAREAQAEFNRINDFYEGNIPESAMDRVKYLSSFVDKLDIGKATNIDMDKILKDNIYKKWMLSKGLDAPAFLRRNEISPESQTPRTALERQQAGEIPTSESFTPRTALERKQAAQKPLSQMLDETKTPGEVVDDTTGKLPESKSSKLNTSGTEFIGIRELPLDVAEYLDASVNSGIKKGNTKDELFVRVYNKMTNTLGRPLSTIESEHLNKLLDEKMQGVDINFADINQKKGPSSPLSQTLVEGPTKQGEDFINETQGKTETVAQPRSPIIQDALNRNAPEMSGIRMKALTSKYLPNLYDLKYALNNIIVKIGDRISEGGSYIQSMQKGVRKGVADNIVESAGVDLTQANREVPKIPLDGLVIRDAMTDTSSTISKNNLGDYQKSIEFTKQKAAEYGLDPDAAARRHLYRLTEGNQALRDQYFSKEEQVYMNDLFAKAYGMPRGLQSTLEADGMIGKANELYEHAVTDFDRIPEEFRSVKLELPDGVREFKTEAEARAFLEMAKKDGVLTPEQYQKAGVGILRHRSDARLNQYRSLDPIVQLHSYADDVGRMYANKKTLDFLDTVRNDSVVGKQFTTYFNKDNSPLNARKDIRMTLLDVYEMPQHRAEKIYQGLDNFMTISKLAGFGKNVAQGTLTTGSTLLSKAILQVIRQKSLKPLSDLSPDIRTMDNNTYRELEREGFVGKTTDYLGNDLADASRMAVEIGTAQPIENFGRARAAITLMRNELQRNGIETKALGTDKDVIAAWNQFVKKGDPNRIIVSRANILSDLDTMGSTSNQSRYDAPWFGKVSKKFKSYFATTAGRMVADAKNIVDAVAQIPEDGIKKALGQDVTKDSAIRMTEIALATGIVYSTAYAFYKSQGDTDEMAEEKAGEMVNFTHGGKFNFILNPVGNAVSLPVPSISLGLAKSVKQAFDIQDPAQRTVAIYDTMRDFFTPLKDLENATFAVTGFDATQALSDKLNTFNPKYLSQYGLARGYGAPENTMEALGEWFGMRGDRMVERILFDRANRISQAKEEKKESKWYDKAIDGIVGLIRKQNEQNQTWQNIKYLMEGKGEEMMQGMTQASDTWKSVKALEGSATEKEWFNKMGIPLDYRAIVRAEIYKMLETKNTNNQTTEESINTTTFADRSLIHDWTNIDRSNYFKKSDDEKLAYWNRWNNFQDTGLTPQAWLDMENRNLETFNKTAKQYIFEAPSEYPLGYNKTAEGLDVLDAIKGLKKTDQRGYNDIVAYIGNFQRAMQNRIEDGLSPVPELGMVKEKITKANLKEGRIEFDPTQTMSQKQYTELLSDNKNPGLKAFLNGIRGSGSDTVDDAGNVVYKQLRGAGQYATPQDDAVISQYLDTEALTTSLSATIGGMIQKFQAQVQQGDKASDKLNYSKVRPRLAELEGLLQFINESGNETQGFKKSVQSTLGNASNIWEKIKGLNIRESYPTVYSYIIDGLRIRGEDVTQLANQNKVDTIDTGVTKPTATGTQKQPLSKLLSTSTPTSAPLPVTDLGVLPDKNAKKGKDLTEKFYKVGVQPSRVMSLSEMLK